uniref:WD repeat-containing protein 19 n=1 Tax=Trichuris muris TaxID=70415 RepID=A0A5S6PZ42_TRIMR
MKQLFSVSCQPLDPQEIHFSIQPKLRNLIAVSNSSDFVTVYNRQGDIFDQIKTFGLPCMTKWHPNGLTLALCDFRNLAVIVWNSGSMAAKAVDINFGVADTICFMTWSGKSQTLAVGTRKGNVLLYFHRSSRIVPIIGVHSKPIADGAYTDDDQLILSSEDYGVTVLSSEGDLLHSCVCPEIPGKLKYVNESLLHTPATSRGTVITALSSRKLYMLEFDSMERTHLLNFSGDHGSIVEFHYLPDMTILCAFQKGHLSLISVAPDRMGQVIFNVQEFQKYFAGVVCNLAAGTITTAGDNSIKTRELNNVSDLVDVMNFEYGEERIGGLELCDDGQLLAIGVEKAVLVYLTHLTTLWDVWSTSVLYLSSLSEVTIYEHSSSNIVGTFKIPFEPTVMAVGKCHFAVGINNLVRFYCLTEQGSEFLAESEYMATVKAIKLSRDQAFVLYGTSLVVHPVGSAPVAGSQSKFYPSSDGEEIKITSISLNAKFIAFSTESGTVVYAFTCNAESLVAQKHTCAIDHLFVQPFGVKGAFIDERRTLYAFDPVSEYCLEIEEDFSVNTLVLWNAFPPEKDLFVVSDRHSIRTFKWTKNAVEGTRAQLVQKLPPPRRATIVLFHKDDKIYLKESQGQDRLTTEHAKHKGLLLQGKPQMAYASASFRWNSRILAAQKDNFNNEEEIWEVIAMAALDELKIDHAIHCFQRIGKADKVWYLNHVKGTENKDLLRARIALMSQQYDLAERLFLDSCCTDEALEMYVNIMDWERAMFLAVKFKPSEVPKISLDYAQELEYSFDYGKAMHYYKKALSESKAENQLYGSEFSDQCKAGIARTTLRTGEIERGVKMAEESGNMVLIKNSASILHEMKHYAEAAGMYQLCKDYDNAALLFLKTKNWSKLHQVLPSVKNPRVFAIYGKAMEVSKDFDAAAQAYQKANDIYRYVRVLIGPLGKVEEAVYAVQESKSPEAAKLLANFFIGRNDCPSAVRLLVLVGCFADALELAKETNNVEVFADAIDEGNPEIYLEVADYFRKQEKYNLAGKFYLKAGNYETAFDYLMKDPSDSSSLKLALHCAASSKDERMISTLLDCLTGKSDRAPKSLKHLFQFYVLLERFNDAAKVAVSLAREKQREGQYRLARDLLFNFHQTLKKKHVTIPFELNETLMLLHTYLLVKRLIKRKEHSQAARLLIRISENINDFSAHVVKIFTLTAIECWRSELQQSAYKWATAVVRPDYRSQVEESYRNTILTIVRKRGNKEEPEVETPCPYCGALLPETQLHCPRCKNTIPFCIASGKHLTSSDLTVCPKCQFLAIYAEFKKLITSEGRCSMCGEAIPINSFDKINETYKYFGTSP